MFCPKCGRDVGNNSVCPYCNTPFSVGDNKARQSHGPEQEKYSQGYYSQQQNPDIPKAEGNTAKNESPEGNKKKLNPIIILVAAVVIVAIAVGVVFAVNGNRSVSEGKSDSESTELKEENEASIGSTSSAESTGTNGEEAQTVSREKIEAEDLKVGFIFLHDENSTCDNNFLTAAKAACEKMGVECITKTNISESNDCYEAAVDLVDSGCSLIFADSFGHEDYMIQAATEFPDVEFCHATGTKAHTVNLPNFHNAYAAIHEGRYLTGVAAGMKINEMIENGDINKDEAVIGFVGSYDYAEVISSYTAFYLGAKSVCPSVTMKVLFTGSWYDETAEKEAAQRLINDGCVLISQYSDSLGAPEACEEAGVPNVAYNGSTAGSCPNTYVVSTKINWQPYFEYAIGCIIDGKAIYTDWTGDLETGSVEICEINDAEAASGTAEAIATAKKGIINGTVKVFDTSTFTVDGKQVTTYFADVDTDGDYAGDTEVITDGQFNESYYRSAPYFNLRIDGIRLLNEVY